MDGSVSTPRSPGTCADWFASIFPLTQIWISGSGCREPESLRWTRAVLSTRVGPLYLLCTLY